MRVTSILAQIQGPGLDGLRDDAIPPFSGASGPLGFETLLQMILALAAVVVLIRWAVPKVANRFARTQVAAQNKNLVIEETVTVGANQIMIVRLGERKLVIGASAQGLTLLAEVADEPAYIPLHSTGDQSAEDQFASVLDRFKRLGG